MKKSLLVFAVVSVILIFTNVLNVSAFNPQPEPPGDKLIFQFVNPAVLVGFNPQPEPPGDRVQNSTFVKLAVR